MSLESNSNSPFFEDQSPATNEPDEQFDNLFQSFCAPDQEQLVHSKVSYFPWMKEIWVFYKRYFGPLLLLGGAAAILGTAASLFSPPAEEIHITKAGKVFSLESESQETEPFIQTETADGKEIAEKQDAKGKDNLAFESETETEGVADGEFFGEETVKEKDFGRGGVNVKIGHNSFLGTLLMLLFQISIYLLLCWTIKTMRSDNGSFRNLLFPSRWSVLKLIGAEILKTAVLVFLCCIFFGGGYLFKLIIPGFFPNQAVPGQAGLPFVIYITIALVVIMRVMLRLFLANSLIIDRNFGVVQSLKESYKYMRKNELTLILGIMSSSFLFLVLCTFFSISFDRVRNHLPEGLESVTPGITFLAYLVIFPFVSVFISVFYLMAIGQCRPGAWEHDDAAVQNTRNDEKKKDF